MTTPLSHALAPGSYGPESFLATVAGLLCIAAPFTGWAPNDAWWCFFAPAIAGIVLIFFAGPARRVGIGFLCATAGFLITIFAFLGGLAVGHLF
ncbi:hypothetical protein [Nocardia acidivorans]|uniref:hypothetical protein n=1 Tax=Nocardia acidivorans TaxID=404580 RepID=UPI00083663C6|nr:hypothetical protein [Nocardia acidivorans]